MKGSQRTEPKDILGLRIKPLRKPILLPGLCYLSQFHLVLENQSSFVGPCTRKIHVIKSTN